MAALALVASALVPAMMLPSSPAASAAADGGTFTVGLSNEVDSFNPFLGIEAPSFEMWALTYDYIIGYSMKDMSPAARPGDRLGDLRRRPRLDLPHPDDVTWSDGEPLTANGHRLHVQPRPRRRAGGGDLVVVPRGVESVEAPDDTTVVLTSKKPNAVLPLLPIPIVPEHIWKDVSEKDVKSFGNEPQDGEPVVGSGPFRFVEGTAGGSTYRFEANPDYWKGAPHVDKVVFRVYKSEDPMVQALIKGEIDFAEGISALQVQ